MARVYIPNMRKIAEGATNEEREKMFEEYKKELIKLNPSKFNSDGSVKTLWQSFSSLMFLLCFYF